jgi:hypothetical protein
MDNGEILVGNGGDTQVKVVPDNLDREKAEMLGKAEQHAILRGREAWKRLKEDVTWEDWMLTGIALAIGRDECLRATHANSVDDKRYRNAFGDWLKVNGFDDIDKAARSRLFKCMDHRADIEAWRATLTMSERLKLIHPNTVVRKWEAATSEGRATLPPAKPGLRDENMRLQEDLDTERAKNRQLERGRDNLTEGRDWTWQDSGKDIGATWFRLHPTKSVQAASEVMRLWKTTTKKPVRSRVG